MPTTTYKTLAEVFAEKFRACRAAEAGALQAKFGTFLEPVFVSIDGAVLIAQNRFPEKKSLQVDLLSALYTNTNNFVVKYIGAAGLARSYAGAGILTPGWFDLKSLDASKEAALFATLLAIGENSAFQSKPIEAIREESL